jgi:serine/threonine protein kinase
MAIRIGTKLAHYEITGHLGTGGMGEVYQAIDSRLGRSVAIKLLPDVFIGDAERTERFEREARVLASLNHSNIAAIHGIDESDGRKFLVMELVPGETLAERIKRGPIPIDDALAIATQLLDGLEAAHEKGVIHRDLKPANIKLTPQSRLKVLDFGLAKAYDTDNPNPGVSNSPTMISMAATNAGMILGTAAYMSPEQARGRAVDRRTDIFAFGCVLYEMVTGKRAFEGEDVAEILSRVLQRDPDWTQLPRTLPPGIRRVLQLCLEKDVKKRRASAADVRIDIEQALTAPESATLSAAGPAAQNGSRMLAWLAAAVFAITAAGMAWIHFREQAPSTPLVQFQIVPKIGGRRNYASVSPDGRWLAYYDLGPDGRPSLVIRNLSSMESHAVPGSSEVSLANAPIWSKDSRYVAFRGADAFMKVPAEGGAAQKVIESPGGVLFGAWNREGTLIAVGLEGVQRASATEAQFTVLHEADASDIAYSTPQFLPDDQHYLFGRASRKPDRDGIFVGSLNPAEEPRRLGAGSTGIAARDPGTGAYYLLVARNEQVTAQTFDLDRLELSGEPLPIGPGLQVSASENGILAIQHGNAASAVLAWYDRRGTVLRSLPPEALLESIDLSPDGSRLAVQFNRDIWLRDLLRGTATRFTTDPAAETIAIWSPPGDRIVFASTGRTTQTSLYLKPSSGATAEELLLSTDQPVWANDWSRDGRYLIYSQGSGTGMDLYVLPMNEPAENRKPIPYLRGAFQKKQGQFSPDGRFVAYASNESGRFEIYVQPFPDPAGGKWTISSGGGVEPRWSRNGTELFFFSGRKLMAVDVKTSPTFNAGAARELFEAPVQPVYTNDAHRWHVAPDGTFLMETFPAELSTNPITIVVNWPELLKKAKGK